MPSVKVTFEAQGQQGVRWFPDARAARKYAARLAATGRRAEVGERKDNWTRRAGAR